MLFLKRNIKTMKVFASEQDKNETNYIEKIQENWEIIEDLPNRLPLKQCQIE